MVSRHRWYNMVSAVIRHGQTLCEQPAGAPQETSGDPRRLLEAEWSGLIPGGRGVSQGQGMGGITSGGGSFTNQVLFAGDSLAGEETCKMFLLAGTLWDKGCGERCG